MASQLLVLSNKQSDIDFWKRIAEREGLQARVSVELTEVAKILAEEPDSLILWDGECEALRGLETLFTEHGRNERVFVVTDRPARSYPYLFSPLSFSHHLNRRYDQTAEFLCSLLVKRSLGISHSRFDDYFHDILFRKSVTLTRSSQKQEVVEEFRRAMLERAIPDRIAEVGSDATDELLMNALFDAPQDENQRHYRRKLERGADFALRGRETVSAELVISLDRVGIRVVDQFGSLNPESATLCLGKNFDYDDYIPSDQDPGAGLGLLKLMKSTMSLAFFVTPGVQTESIALMGNTRNFRDFRKSFCFFSVQSSPEPNRLPK